MKANNTTYLKEENLLSLLSLNNMIVPEIQREYVWGKAENKSVLERFLSNLKNNSTPCDGCYQAHKIKDINTGFLYSYKPSYVTLDHERYMDEYLIDGQQRYTTLFLLLAYLAIKEKRTKDFLTLIRFDKEMEEINFDYKVRDLTHRFLIDFLSAFNEDLTIDEILQGTEPPYAIPQTWFLSDYCADVTIQAMLGALHTVHKIFNDQHQYFDYVLTAVRFWHFKTEATSQGEELYITMNSRGEPLSKPDEDKAQILTKENLRECGETWEKWQDFFWKNRDGNSNADEGFNAFLRCIAGLEYYLKDKNKEKPLKDIPTLLTPEKIENYYNAFTYLINNKESFKEQYSYADWVDNCLKEIWAIFNKNETDWFANYRDDDRATERKRMIFIWSWLYYFTEIKNDDKPIDTNELFRLLRFFYVRYYNNNRSVSALKEIIDMIIANGIYDSVENEAGSEDDNAEEETDKKFRTQEETDKNNLFAQAGIKLTATESIVWKIEDLSLNIDGSDLGAVNISHLVDLKNNPTLQDLQTVYYRFMELFPSKDCNPNYEKNLKTLLLHYKDEKNNPFWNRVSPWNYENYDCSDWRRIIRGTIFKEIFPILFDNSNNIILENLLEQKKKDFYSEFQTVTSIKEGNLSQRKQLIVYSDLVDIWKRDNIAFDNIIPENETRIFKKEQRIYNLNKNFKNSNYKELWVEIKDKNIDEELQKILDKYSQ